jgi:hypothetical protein
MALQDIDGDTGHQQAPGTKEAEHYLFQRSQTTASFHTDPPSASSRQPAWDKKLFQWHTKTVPTQQSHGITTDQIKKAPVGKITFESPTSPRSVVIDAADIFAVVLLQKYTSPIVGMDHINPADGPHFGFNLSQGSPPKFVEPNIDSHKTTHFFYEFNLVGLQLNPPVTFATKTTLMTFMKNTIQICLIQTIGTHRITLLQ